MKTFRIEKSRRSGEGYESMRIIDCATGELIAEYRLTAHAEAAQIKVMRRSIDKHLSAGGTLKNYQW